MAGPNYGAAKRARELKRKAKREAKLARKRARKTDTETAVETGEPVPPGALLPADEPRGTGA